MTNLGNYQSWAMSALILVLVGCRPQDPGAEVRSSSSTDKPFAAPQARESTPAHGYREYPEYISPISQVSYARLSGRIKLDQLAPELARVRQVVDQISKVPFVLSNNCTANFISDDGHAVTALHCLGWQREFIPDTERSFVRFPSELLGKKIKPRAQVTSQFGTSEDVKITVLDTGKGYPNYVSNEDSLERARTDFKRLSHLNDDYAIIKLDGVPKGYSCAKTAEATVSREHDTLVWCLGFPTGAGRSDTLVSLYSNTLTFRAEKLENKETAEAIGSHLGALSGIYRKISWPNPSPVLMREQFLAAYELWIALGRLYTSAVEMEARSGWPTDELARQLDAIYPPARFFTSTCSGKGGMSGGGVFDLEGKLVAVNSAAFGPSRQRRVKQSLRHASIAHIRREVSRKLGEEESREIFKCENREAKPDSK